MSPDFLIHGRIGLSGILEFGNSPGTPVSVWSYRTDGVKSKVTTVSRREYIFNLITSCRN